MTRSTGRHLEVDLLVIGAGAGGMTAALVAAVLGLDVLLVEKTAVVGGTTALSAGSVWVPGSHHSPPGSDDGDNARRYLQAAIGDKLRAELTDAFLTAGPDMVRFLEEHTVVQMRAYAYHPDYLADLPGATLRGRVLEPLPFDARVLGRDFARLRPPLPEFTLLGGMMVDRTDIGHLLNASHSLGSLRHAADALVKRREDEARDVSVDRRVRLLQVGDGAELAVGRGQQQLAAACRQIRREDLRIPSARRPDLDHRVVRLDAEEAQRLNRVAVAVAQDVSRRAP